MDQLLPLKTIRIVAYVVGGLAVLTAGYYGYTAIYDRGYQAMKTISEEEKAAQKAANDKAITLSEKDMREDVAVLVADKEKLENDVARLTAEAALDPDAHSGGIKRSSVQRLNAIQ